MTVGEEDETMDDTQRHERARLKARRQRLSNIPKPTHVVIMDSEDAILKSRALSQCEEDAKQKFNAEEKFEKRIQKFRDESNPEKNDNLASFFEKNMSIDVLEVFDSGTNRDRNNETIQRYLESGGKPYNFHPTREEAKNIEKEEETRKVYTC